MNYLELVNAVLRRMREDEVSSVTESTYSTLIGDLVNETKREVEDAWNWSMLRTEIDVTTAASDSTYSLTDSGERFRILYAQNITEDVRMCRVDLKYIRNLENFGTQTEAAPHNYIIDGSDSNRDATISVNPVPDAVYTLRFHVVVPQDDLTGTTEMSIPPWPVVLGATSKAYTERGEDNSNTIQELLMRYNATLSDAIAGDAALYPHETVWRVV